MEVVGWGGGRRGENTTEWDNNNTLMLMVVAYVFMFCMASSHCPCWNRRRAASIADTQFLRFCSALLQCHTAAAEAALRTCSVCCISPALLPARRELRRLS